MDEPGDGVDRPGAGPRPYSPIGRQVAALAKAIEASGAPLAIPAKASKSRS